MSDFKNEVLADLGRYRETEEGILTLLDRESHAIEADLIARILSHYPADALPWVGRDRP